MSANQAPFPIATMARVLGASEAGYHAWRKRPPSKRQEADTKLLQRVRTIHASSRQTYGADRVPPGGVGGAAREQGWATRSSGQ
jgi:putative transposase